MKKYIILFIVIVITVIAIYINTKGSKINKPVVQPTTNTQQIGVELPQSQSAITTDKAIVTDNINTTIPPTYTQLTGCNKTLKDIIEDHGTVWGEIPKKENNTYSFSKEESETILILLAEYIGCTSLAKEKPQLCNTLPGVSKEMCEAEYYNYKFREYVIGKNKNIKDCLTYFEMEQKWLEKQQEENKLKNLGINDINLLCQNIKLVGMDKICDNMVKDKSKLSKCYELFPKSIDQCDDDKECVMLFQVLKSYRDTGNLECSTIPKPKYREKCEIARIGETACSEKLNKLTLTYCDFYSKIIQKNLKKKENKKINKLEEELDEEKIKKLEEEIIKKSKEILKKQKNLPGGKDEE